MGGIVHIDLLRQYLPFIPSPSWVREWKGGGDFEVAIRKRWAGLLCPSSFLPGASCWRNDGFNNFQLDVMSFLLFPAVQHNGMHWVLRWDETARTEECFSSACLSLFLTSSDRMFQMEILSTQKTFLLIFEWSTLTPFYFIIFWSQRKAFFSLFFLTVWFLRNFKLISYMFFILNILSMSFSTS